MSFSRRDLLKLALAGAAHPLMPVRGIVSQLFAAPGAADAKFLLVFLRGGYDAANVVDQDRHMHVEMRVNTENNFVPFYGEAHAVLLNAWQCVANPNRRTGHSRCKQTKLLSGHRRRARQRQGNAGPESTGQRKGSGPIPARVRPGRTFEAILD